MTNNAQNQLTRLIKRVLDGLSALAIAALVICLLAVAIMVVGKSSNSESWGVDIGVVSGLSIDLKELNADLSKSVGVRDPIISGKAVLGLDTRSTTALYVFTAITVIGGLVGLYVLLQLRALFASLVNGVNFSKENSRRIRNTGLAVIAWVFINPLLEYFGGQAILNEYALNVDGIRLLPTFSIDGMAMFIGLAMLILSGVLNEATRIHEDSQLTI